MKKEYTWNPIYNLVMKIKYDYINKFNDNIIDFKVWIDKLNNKEYNNFFECLQTNQKDNLLLIRYGLSEMQSGMWDDTNSPYRECRSIVVDLKNEEIVVCPFRKFFNINETDENEIGRLIKEIKQSKTFEITNKLDGSMQSARWYDNKIMMFGSMALSKEESFRLEEGITMLTDKHKSMIKDNPNLTFIFEYISLKDTHVVIYKKEQEGLYLIGIRDVYTGIECSYKDIKLFSDKYSVPMTNIENITLDEVLEQMKIVNGSDKEGWVLNIDGRKVKCKCDDYVHLHRILDEFSSINTIIENIVDDKFDDMMSKIPVAYRERVLLVANKVFNYKNKINKEINYYFDIAPNKDNKKEFMIWVTNNCPKNIQGYIRNKWYGTEYNVLKTKHRNKRLNEMGIKDYSELFRGLEEDKQ